MFTEYIWDGAAVLAQLLLGLLVFDTACAFRRGWRVKSRGDRLGVVAVLGACGILGLGLIGCGLSPAFRACFWGLLGAASLTFLVAVALETSLRLWPGAPSRLASFYRKPPWLRFGMRIPAGELPGVAARARFSANSLGLRGPEPPRRDEAYRILCLGGSTTECFYLDDERTWPFLLMRYLNERGTGPVWVGNAGEGGYASRRQVRFVRQSALLGEIDCLLILAGVINLFQGTVPQPPESGRRRRRPPLWRDSALFRMCGNAVRAWRARSEARRHWSDVSLEKLRRQRRVAEVRGALPNLDAGLAAFRARVREIAEACARKGVRLLFATQPVLWHDHLSPQGEALLWCGSPHGVYYSPAALRTGMERFNDALLEECAALGVDCVDLRALSGREHLYYDDCHVNEEGAEELAWQLAEAFDRKPWRAPARRRRRLATVFSNLPRAVALQGAALVLGLVGALLLGPVPDPVLARPPGKKRW